MQELVSEMSLLFALVSCMVAIYTTWMYRQIRVRNMELVDSHRELYYRHCDLTEENMKLINIAMQLEIERGKLKAFCDNAHCGMASHHYPCGCGGTGGDR